MSSSPDTKEKFSSQIPALKFLNAIGYSYLTLKEADDDRNVSSRNVLLYPKLREAIRSMPSNQIKVEGKMFPPPEGMIDEAVRHIDNHICENLIADNRDLFKKLTVGDTFRGTIEGREVQKHLHYIDFENTKNNNYFCTEEYSVLRSGVDKEYRPDVVAFINGLPVIIIECKRWGAGKINLAVKDHLDKQKDDGIKRLYVYSQILVALAENQAMYGSIGAPIQFWNNWKEMKDERDKNLLEIHGVKNQPVPNELKNAIFSWRQDEDKAEMERVWSSGEIHPTEQDKLIYNLLRPERVLKQIKDFTVFEGDAKIVSRHQQFFGIEKAMVRLNERDEKGNRRGGLIWHTTGSGKSVTMVMLAQKILEPEAQSGFKDPRVVVVTDRVDLDKNIHDCFLDCGVTAFRAPRSSELAEKVSGKNYKVITTVIDKFKPAFNRYKAQDDSKDIVILVDEAHRSHSKDGNKRAMMQAVFPNAAIIGFTGTPIKNNEKDDVKLYGGWIHKYTMDEALEDKAVCEIIYTNRNCPLNGDVSSLDRLVDRKLEQALKSGNATKQDVADIKKQYKRQNEVLKATERIQEICYDISLHYQKNYRAPEGKVGLKAMVATSSKYEALQYTEELRKNGISCNLIMSPPGEAEGNTTVRESESEELKDFWKKEVEKPYGDEKRYLEDITNQFKKSRNPEMLVVVDKLLTGFNNPRSAVLYLDKKLNGHNVLQAIARVNRPFDGKEYGLVVDYRNIIGEVTDAIGFYRKLQEEGYEPDEVKDALGNVDKEIAKLDGLLKDVWEVFPSDANTFDRQVLVRHLYEKENYLKFIIALKKFHYVYKLALGDYNWIMNTDDQKKKIIDRDYKYFVELRAVAEDDLGGGRSLTYASFIDDIRRTVQTRIEAEPPVVMVDHFDIFSKEYLDRSKKKGPRAQADGIRVRLGKFFEENWDDDPILAKKMTKIITETYERYKDKLDEDIKYIEEMMEHWEQSQSGSNMNYPDEIVDSPEKKAYFGVLKDQLSETLKMDNEEVVRYVFKIQEVVIREATRDWPGMKPIKDRIESGILEDIIWPMEEKLGHKFENHDEILDNLVRIAVRHQGY